MKILITGGLGYIGSHTTVALLEAGFEVVILDNLSNSSLKNLEQIERITQKRPKFYQKDVTLVQELMDVFEEEQGIKAVIHFAAKKAVAESVAQPALYFLHNNSGLTNLMYVMDVYKCHKLIFSSSATVYGLPKEVPIVETAPFQVPASSPYARTKQLGETFIEDLTQTTGLRSVILRYFNPIGAHHSTLLGELPQGIPNNLMPYITQVAIGKRPYLNVYGGDYDTPDGTCIRDYIHVEDLAQAHLKALEYLNTNPQITLDVFNIGTGKGYSVLEVIHSTEKVLGRELPYKLVERRAGDVPSYYSNPTKAQEHLNWKAKYTLDDMTRSSWLWECTLEEQHL
jgi:UDP-glucose 4-epimerase